MTIPPALLSLIAFPAIGAAAPLIASDVQIDIVDLSQSPLSGVDLLVFDADGVQLADIEANDTSFTAPVLGDSITIFLPDYGTSHVVDLLGVDTAVRLEVSTLKGVSRVAGLKPFGGNSPEIAFGTSLGPVNDDCDNAIPLMDGATMFSTLGATTDGTVGTNNNDIWFEYTATCTGDLTISTCDQADYDTDLLILTADSTCADQNSLAINDDGPGCTGFTSILTASVVEGETYLVSVGGFADTSAGTGQLTVTCELPPPPPANDECADAIPVTLGEAVTVDNTFATDAVSDPAFSCALFGPAQGSGSVWFSFVAESTGAQCDTTDSMGATDTLLAVYEGDCASLVEIGCNDDPASGGLLSQVTLTDLIPGVEYFVQVASFSAASLGEITLVVTNGPAVDPCNGSGVNTSTMDSALTQAIVGQDFTLSVSDGSAGSLVAFSATKTMLPLSSFGELLIAPPVVTLPFSATGDHTVPVPDNANLIGVTIYFQGFSVADLGLTNALAITVGAF